MVVLDAYIPIDRRFALAHGGELPDRAEGAVLFADISGFTSTASALAEVYGARQGADELTLRVNRLYAEMVGVVHRYGGSVVSFSGDAITCWFDERLFGERRQPGDGPRRATACALAMQALLRPGQGGTAPTGGWEFGFKISVVAGTARRFLAGLPRIQLLDVLAGALLDRSAAAEQVAQPGQVVVGAEILRYFGSGLHVEKWVSGRAGEHFAAVTGLAAGVEEAPWPELPPIAPDVARVWLLPPVYERLMRGEGEFLAELRPVVAIFFRFSGVDYDGDAAAGDKLSLFTGRLQTTLLRFGGYLLQLVVGDKGSYGLAAVGVSAAQEDDALRAVAAAAALLKLPQELESIADLCAGASWGPMLVGAYGGPMRRTFSLQGNETNVAARLMEVARPGQILVTERVAAVAAKQFNLSDQGQMVLKGLGQPLPVFAVEGRKSGQVGITLRAPVEAPIVGRRQELDSFRRELEGLLAGRSGTIVLEGEAGIGKSRLVAAFLVEAEAAGVTALLGVGDAIEQATPFHAWRPVFRTLLGLDGDERGTLMRERLAEALGNRKDAKEAAALVDGVLGLGRAPGEEAPRATLDGRVDVVRELLLALLARQLQSERGRLLVVDDAQWLDSASWALLNDARLALGPLLTVVASRPVVQSDLAPREYRALVADPGTTRLNLAPLAPQEAAAMVAQHLRIDALPEPVARFVLQRAEGHPFFSEEIAHALIDTGVLKVENGKGTLATRNGELDRLEFPVTVQGVVASRIDRLNPATQLTLKVASVIGRTFTCDGVYSIHPVAADREHVLEHLAELTRLDIATAEPDGDGTYSFRHALIQEIAYGRLLTAQRRQLHRAMAEWLEAVHVGNPAPVYPVLAHHWQEAAAARAGDGAFPGLVAKALHYTEKAGEQALNNTAYREAITFFREALALVAARPQPEEDERRARWLQQLGEAYHQWGQWSEARAKLAEAAMLYSRPVPINRVAVVAGLVRELLRQTRHRLWPSRAVGAAAAEERAKTLRLAHIYQSLAELSYLTNETAFSLYAILVGLNLSEHAGLSPELVKAYGDIAVIVGLFGPRRLAESYQSRAWHAAQALDDAAVLAGARLSAGLESLNAGRLEEAQANLEEALRLSAALPNRRLWGDSIGLLARAVRFRGDLRRADGLYAELGGPRSGVMMHRVWAYNAQAGVALRQGRLEDAFSLLQLARSLPGENPEPQQEIITWGFLATAQLRAGEHEQARAAAERTMALMASTRVTAYTHFEAFATVAEVFLILWETAVPNSPAAAESRAAAQRLCRALRRQATPSGQPAGWLYQGWYAWLDGRPRSAFRDWSRGLAAARETGMRYEEGRIHLETARRLPASDPTRRRHLRQAFSIFEATGDQFQLEAVQALLDAGP